MSRRVLIVDDVWSVRRIVRMAFESHDQIEVVGEAANANEARDKIHRLKPDVLTLDVEMPGLRGDLFLKQIMAECPMPVIMLSNMTRATGPLAVQALADGAVDCIQKPSQPSDIYNGKFSKWICDAVLAANLNTSRITRRAPTEQRSAKTGSGAIFIGASTGGVAALETVLSRMPRSCPPIIVAQHIPENFVQSLVDLLNARTSLDVRIAAGDERLIPGHVLIAQGGTRDLVLNVDDPTRVSLIAHSAKDPFCPSVDSLFQSASVLGSQAAAVVLTGMGRDGAKGLQAVHKAGGFTIAQDHDSSAVFGMPKAAIAAGAVSRTLPLDLIAGHLTRWSEDATAQVSG